MALLPYDRSVIITCPECASEFDVPFAMIGPGGRTVRCANCRAEWHAEMPKPAQPVENPYKKIDTPVSATGFEIEFDIFKNRSDAPEFKPNPSSTSRAGPAKPAKTGKAANLNPKTMAVALVALLAFTTIFGLLSPILGGAGPALAAMYRGFGIEVKAPGEGLGIDRLHLKTVWEGRENRVELTTRILNLTEAPQKVQDILVEVMGQDGKPTSQAWTLKPPVAELPPHEAVPYVTRLPDMPKVKGETVTLRASFH